MWGKIIIPIYRLWLHGLYGLYGPCCLLSPERLLNFITHSLTHSLNIVFIVLSAVESWLYPCAREGRVHVSWSLLWSPGVSSERCARASFVVASRVWCSGAQQLHCGCHRGGVLFLWINLSVLINTLKPRQNGRHSADDVFKSISLKENFWILYKISLQYVP